MNIFRKKIFKILFAIFASFFMGVFGFGIFQFFGGNAIVNVDGERIKVSRYLEVYNNLIQEVQITEQSQTDFLKRRAINNLVTTAIILQDAKKAGLAVTKRELQDKIRQNTNFSSVEGEFDVEAYYNFLDQVAYSPTQYESSLQNSIIYSKYLQLFSPPAKLTSVLENFYQSYYQRKAQVRYVTVPEKIWKIGYQITDEKIQDFYNSKVQDYRKPTQYSTFLFYFPKSIIDISISDSAVSSYLSRNQDQYIEKEQYKSSHILLSLENTVSSTEVRKRINEIYQQLAEDKTQFSKLAEKYSEDEISKKQGGDLGWVNYGDFVSEFEDVIRELEVGDISKPFLTEFGYHIVYLEEKKQSILDEEKAKQEIKLLLEKRRFNDYLTGVLDDLIEGLDYSIVGKDQQKIIDKHQLVISNAIIHSDSEYEGSVLSEIYFDLQNYVEKNPNFKELQKEVVGEDEKEKPAYFGYTIIDEGAVFYQLLDTVLGEKIEFETIKEEVKRDLERVELQKIANTQASILSEKYKTKEDFEKSAIEWEAEIKNIEIFYAIPVVDSLSSSIKDRIFKQKSDSLFFLQNDKDLYGVLIDNIIQDASLDTIDFQEELEIARNETIANRYLLELLKNANIKENDKLFKQYNIPTR